MKDDEIYAESYAAKVDVLWKHLEATITGAETPESIFYAGVSIGLEIAKQVGRDTLFSKSDIKH